MELVIERGNWKRAWKRVTQNKGSPGIDGMTVGELGAWLWENGAVLREQLLAGTFEPFPVRRVEIPKSGGGMRMLGIPTVRDRFVQQLFLQVLQPLFDPTFSEHSFGFRPGRKAHDAICEAQQYIQAGRLWVVDVDLEKFFDRVNHDVLMALLAKRIADKRLLRVIRRFLEAGIMVDGVAREKHEGTPQGGPLSPLLANVLLDEVDKELERRGHSFVRYADDCNVYVRSKRSGERVMEALRSLFSKLRLRINEEKSAVDRPWRRDFLGYSFWMARDGTPKRKLGSKALVRMKHRIKELTRRNAGRTIPEVVRDLSTYLGGKKPYLSLIEVMGPLREIDEWLRHRLRAIQLKHWTNPRTIYRELRIRGISDLGARRVAAKPKSWWANSSMLLNVALPSVHYERMGLPRLAPQPQPSNRRMRTRMSGGVGGDR